MSLLLVSLLAALHFEGDVTAGDGDYTLVAFEVPAGTAEIQIAHGDGSGAVILDWGVWGPDGFRGWGGGLVDDAIIGVDASSRGYLPGPIAPGTWTLVVGKAKLAGGTGHYVVDVTFRTEPTLAPIPRAPFAPRVLRTGAAWYRGDFHVHSEESGDAAATFPQIIDLARERGLDFVVLSDHNTISQHGRQAAAQADVDDVLLMRGNEVTTYHGHGNAVGSSAYIDHRVGLGGVGAATVLDAVAAQGAAFIVNHPTLDLGDMCIGCAWTLPDTPWDKVAAIEIHNGNFDIGTALFTPAAIALWETQLDAGHRIAAVGGSDDHRAGMDEGLTGSPIGSPTTLVWAPELSEAAILAAMKQGRTQVLLRGPDDPHVELTLTDKDGQERTIGDVVAGAAIDVLTARVVGAGASTSLVVVRDGVIADQVAVTGADFQQTFRHPALAGSHRYRAELTDGSARIVVTSPIYVSYTPPPTGDTDGGGCRSGGAGGGWLAIVGVGAALAAITTRARGPRRASSRPPRACRGGSA